MKLSYFKADECPNDAYENAKPYTSIPGPTKFELFKLFAPGGEYLHILHECDKSAGKFIVNPAN